MLCRHRRRNYALIDQLLEIGWGKQKNGPPTGQGWRAALTPTVVGAVQVITLGPGPRDNEALVRAGVLGSAPAGHVMPIRDN